MADVVDCTHRVKLTNLVGYAYRKHASRLPKNDSDRQACASLLGKLQNGSNSHEATTCPTTTAPCPQQFALDANDIDEYEQEYFPSCFKGAGGSRILSLERLASDANLTLNARISAKDSAHLAFDMRSDEMDTADCIFMPAGFKGTGKRGKKYWKSPNCLPSLPQDFVHYAKGHSAFPLQIRRRSCSAPSLMGFEHTLSSWRSDEVALSCDDGEGRDADIASVASTTSTTTPYSNTCDSPDRGSASCEADLSQSNPAKTEILDLEAIGLTVKNTFIDIQSCALDGGRRCACVPPSTRWQFTVTDEDVVRAVLQALPLPQQRTPWSPSARTPASLSLLPLPLEEYHGENSLKERLRNYKVRLVNQHGLSESVAVKISNHFAHVYL